MSMGWDFRLDDLGHRLHLPRFIQSRLCDWWEKRLMGPEEFENQKEFMRKLWEEDAKLREEDEDG